MRHGLLIAFALAAGLSLVPLRVIAADKGDQAFFQQHISELVKVEPTRLEGLALEQLVAVPIYKVKVEIGDGSSTTLLVAREGDKIVPVTLPSTTEDMPNFIKIISPKFTLSSEHDGKVFQEALDALYPIDTGFGEDDVKAKAIRHQGQTWTFIRGKFFEHFKGFVVTTDASGKITKVTYSLDIK